MAANKLICALFGILVISAWVLGSAIQAGAETLNFKVYTWAVKQENIPVGDAEGHNVGSYVRPAFIVFENGEVATSYAVGTFDWLKPSISIQQYKTWTFSDGSTMFIKTTHGIVGGTTEAATSGGWKSEIIKGTGRFEGIKGTERISIKYLPQEKWEVGQKGYGEGTITYTLPSK